MDADRNGIPCETVYPSDDIELFLMSAALELPGRYCRDLAADGFSFSSAVGYWLLESRPDRMDADGDGIPCETVYSQHEMEALIPSVHPPGWSVVANHDSISDVAVGTDGRIWTVGGGGAVEWDVQTGAHTPHTVVDGLASQAVHSVDIAPDGTVWLATDGGASVFDGFRWTTILPGEQLFSVVITGDGRAWLGGRAVVAVWDNSSVVRFDHEDGLSTDITHFAEGLDGTIYASQSGCEGEACLDYPAGESYPDIVHLAGEQWESIVSGTVDGHAVGSLVTVGGPHLAIDAQGRLWASGDSRVPLLSFDRANWTGYQVWPAGHGDPKWFWSMAMDELGVVWGAHGNLLVRWDGLHAQGFIVPARDGERLAVTSIAVDGRGLWIGTNHGLAHRSDAGKWTWYRTGDPLSSNSVAAIAATADELWVGGAAGLDRISSAEWITYDELPYPASQVSEVLIAGDASIWAGSWNGLARFDGTAWEQEAGTVPIATSADGTVWASRHSGGTRLIRHRNGAWEELQGVPQACGRALSLETDGRNVLWVRTGTHGLCSFDGAEWVTHFDPPGWDPVWEPRPEEVQDRELVYSVATEQGGTGVAIGTTAGVFGYSGQDWVPLGSPDGAPAIVGELEFGLDGTIWMVSGPTGEVAVYDAGTWYSIDARYLAGLYVTDVQVDPVGTVWIGTSGGMFHFVPTDVHRPR